MSPADPIVVVTRHPALVALLRERGHVGPDAVVLTHVDSPEQIRGRIVVGVLPLRLAAEAREVWEIPLEIPAALRGSELTLEQLRGMAGELVAYHVYRIDA